MSTPIKKRLSLSEFESYVKNKDFGELPPTFIVLHHTWKPTKKDWKGKITLDGVDNYYRSLGWNGLGPHLFIAEDGIWLFTDMYDVGIHAGAGNGSLKTGYSIGIEVVGNYDSEVWSGETYKNTVGALKILMSRLNISEDQIKFHRDYSSKSCPGKAITKDWVFNQLEEKMSEKNYHTASKLENVLQKIWSKFDGDKEDSHKDMAEKLDKYINDQERLVETNKKEVEKLEKEKDALINSNLDNNEYLIELEEKLELAKIDTNLLIEAQNNINKAHDEEMTALKEKIKKEIIETIQNI